MKRILVTACSALTIFLFSLAGQAQEATAPSSTAPEANVTGSGTKNFVPLWTGTTTVGNSKIFQTGGKIGVGTTTPAVNFDVNGRINASKAYRLLNVDVFVMPGNDPTNGDIGLGFEALTNVTPDFGIGSLNTAVGYSALFANVTGNENTALGTFALSRNLASFNTALGNGAMELNTTGEQNAACGGGALFNNISGQQNTGVGIGALPSNTSGNLNIAVGFQAALNVSGGNSNNIHIGSLGVSTDNGVMRLGTSGAQTSFFAAGVSGVTTGLNNAVPIVIDSNGQLGTVSSSLRYKEDIQDMGEASRGLMRLRPVTFRYEKPFVDGTKPIQYGLIAEEVAEVYPDLVARSGDGQIETVKYQVLDSMLLNEVQRQQEQIRSLQERLAKMEAALEKSK